MGCLVFDMLTSSEVESSVQGGITYFDLNQNSLNLSILLLTKAWPSLSQLSQWGLKMLLGQEKTNLIIHVNMNNTFNQLCNGEEKKMNKL